MTARERWVRMRDGLLNSCTFWSLLLGGPGGTVIYYAAGGR